MQLTNQVDFCTIDFDLISEYRKELELHLRRDCPIAIGPLCSAVGARVVPQSFEQTSHFRGVQDRQVRRLDTMVTVSDIELIEQFQQSLPLKLQVREQLCHPDGREDTVLVKNSEELPSVVMRFQGSIFIDIIILWYQAVNTS